VAILLLIALGALPEPQSAIFEAGVFAARPSVLSAGQLFGPKIAGAWRGGPWSLGLRGELGFVRENDPTFEVSHTEARLLLIAAYVYALGEGELSFGAGLGGVALHEVRTRHQGDRLRMAGLDPELRAWGGGALLQGELAFRLYFYERWALSTELAPSLSIVDGLRPGWSLGLSLARAFGE
jgi:hypothetical protein